MQLFYAMLWRCFPYTVKFHAKFLFHIFQIVLISWLGFISPVAYIDISREVKKAIFCPKFLVTILVSHLEAKQQKFFRFRCDLTHKQRLLGFPFKCWISFSLTKML